MTDRDIIIKDELPVLEPNTIEKIQIKQLMNLYENLDYLMALVLVKSSAEQRAEFLKNSKSEIFQYKPMTTQILKNNISIL